MELKRGYKQSELGAIPKDWDVGSLASVSERVMVGIASAATHAYRLKGIPLLRNQNIKAGWLDDADILFVDEEYEKVFRNKRLKTGDLLTARTGYPGMTCVIPPRFEGAQSFTTLITRPRKDCVDSVFLCHFINSGLGQSFFDRSQIGGAQKNVNAGALREMPVPVPPLAEQEAIAGVLGDVDALVVALDRLISKKRDLTQAAMQQLLTGKTRLRGFQGEWKQTTFGSVVRHHAGNSALIKGKLPSSEATGLFPAYSASGQDVWCDHFEHEGDAIVVSAVGSRCGKAFVASGKWCAIANTHVVWPNAEKIDWRFLAFFINDEDFWQKSGTGQPFVLFAKTFARPLCLPTLTEQTAIAAALSDMDTEIAALEARRNKTRDLKQAMMQELLTGKTRLVSTGGAHV